MRKLTAVIISLALIFGSIICLNACKDNKADEPAPAPATSAPAPATATDTGETVAPGEHPVVKVTMKNGGSFNIELYPEFAPATVENFIKLADSGFYDGVSFHRVVDNFMAQGGDPDGDGRTESGGITIKGEFASNGYPDNTLSHQRGVVSMARTTDPDSAYSQFFICYADCSSLDGKYAAFGKVDEEGMKVVDSFLDVKRVMGSDGAVSSPVEPIIMEKVEVVSR